MYFIGLIVVGMIVGLIYYETHCRRPSPFKESQMALFEAAIILNPTKNEAADGKQAEILMQPRAFIAPDIENAKVTAIRSLPPDENGQSYRTSRLEVLVRPFEDGL